MNALTRRSRSALIGGGAAAALLVPIVGAGLMLSPAYSAPSADAETTRIASAGEYSERVPDGVCSVNVTVAGGHGGNAAMAQDPDHQPGDPDDGGDGDGTPGAGAVVTAQLDVQAGALLEGLVGSNGSSSGGAGTHGGGGAGGAGTHRGGAGGGYSTIAVGGQTVLLAGGGGGTGGGHTIEFGGGGDAGAVSTDGVAVAGGTVFPGQGGSVGQDRDADGAPHQPGAGAGGTSVAGGAGGVSLDGDANGLPGQSLQGGQGGGPDGADQGGGGGGGFFGGGGGASTNGDVSFAHEGETYYIVGGGGGGGSTFVSGSALLSDVDLGLNLDEDDAVASSFVELDWVMCEYDLGVTKSVVGPSAFDDGQAKTFSVTVTNNGPDPMVVGDTVTLEDDYLDGATLVSVSGDLTDADVEIGDEIAGTELELFDLVDVDGTDERQGLAPGESVTVEYSVVLTGTAEITNTVTVADRGGDPSNDVANATLAPAAPSLSLVKSASDTKITGAGQQITYSFVVTNTGNIELREPAIQETSFSGKGTRPTPTCPADEFLPGESITCTAVYTTVADDLNGGPLANTATASALSPNGTRVLSAASSASLTPPARPAALLPGTGLEISTAMLVAAATAVLIGAGITVISVRHRKADAA